MSRNGKSKTIVFRIMLLVSLSRWFLGRILETARICNQEKLRRNSDSAVVFCPKEETPPVLKIINERIAVIERKIEQLPPEILEDFSPEEKATKFLRQHESWKGINLYFTHGCKRCCQPRQGILLRYNNERRKNQIKNTRRNLCLYDSKT